MAKIQDKLFNRVIEGDLLELSDADKERAGIGGGGTQIYRHNLTLTATAGPSSGSKLYLVLITTKGEPITSQNLTDPSAIGYICGYKSQSSFNFGAPLTELKMPFYSIQGSTISGDNTYGATVDSDNVSLY